jgi:ATP-dependent Clp protease ATP-binding subunit ClpC
MQTNTQNTSGSVSLQSLDEFFSDSMRRILILANEEAKQVHAEDIDTEHCLMGLLKNIDKDAVLKRIFQKIHVDIPTLVEDTKKEIHQGKNRNSVKFLPFSARTKNALIQADMERRKFRHHATAGEHFLLALTVGDGVASKILKRYNIRKEELEKSIIGVIGVGKEKDVLVTENTPTLDKYGIDLCQQAREGKIDPVIGRSDEIERTIHILARRRKNNPLLVGNPGVGKTAIVEGLANRIVRGDVPDVLKGKRIISLSINTIVAGASRRGEFEKRLEEVIKEAIKSNGEVILFIDEIHTLISSGSAGDAAQILKPPLARGEIHLIGATTTAEHHEHIEKDAAFSRRLQVVSVPEPSFEETFLILQGARDKYEAFHKVKISDEILHSVIILSTRYINDRYLPDKAFDLLDEAAAMARMPSISVPEKEKKLQKEIQKLRAEQERAKGVVNIEELTHLEKKIHKKTKILEEIRLRHEEEQSRSHDKIELEHIARVISRWSGIQLSHISGTESNRLLLLEKNLHERLIGQDYATKCVAAAVRRGRSGIRKPKRPIGSFLFMGSSGVGKTEFAKTLAENLFGKEEAVIRFDMSEFMEKHAVARLTGPPPGYVGYEKGGELTEAVRNNPYSVVLMDEVEKAHPDVFHLLLQILDDGRLTDNHGRLVSFKHTIIICTSNLGADVISEEYENFWDSQRRVLPRKQEIHKEEKREGEKRNKNLQESRNIREKIDRKNIPSSHPQYNEDIEKREEKKRESTQQGEEREKTVMDNTSSHHSPLFQKGTSFPKSSIPQGTLSPEKPNALKEENLENDFLRNFIESKK